MNLQNIKESENLKGNQREKILPIVCQWPSHRQQDTRRQWNDIFKVGKGNNCHPRILYLDKLSVKCNNKIKLFSKK